MSLISAGGAVTGSGDVGYQIERSLRFNSADSAYLNRTPASASNRKTWTWSGWVKRSSGGGPNVLSLFFAESGGNTNARIEYLGAGSFRWFYQISGVDTSFLVTNALYRDFSAWYHVVFVLDTTQATSTNRAKLYINGIQVTSFSSTLYPSQNLDTSINDTVVHWIGQNNSPEFFSGYMTEIHFIDGQALTPTSFGEFNSDTGVWQPIEYTGTYGTNGFYLPFSDNASTTTLGDDFSGNGNDWTTNNFSVTAGAGNDSLVDSPTRYGTDTGAGGEVRGNYATLNPLEISAGSLSNGNLSVATSSASNAWVTSTMSFSTNTYVEVEVGTNLLVGLAWNTTENTANNWFQASSQFAFFSSGNAILSQNVTASYTPNPSWSNGNTLGLAWNESAKTLTLYVNGVSNSVMTITAPTTQPRLVLAASTSGAVYSATANFGQRPFEYTAPSGFKALVTTNLPAPTIADGGEYFNTILYTGTGASNARTGVGFQPDFVWIKERNGAADHGLYDVLRGVQNQLESNTTTAETAEANGLTAFGTDGFTVGSLAQLNTNNDTYVAWNWKANGAGVSNTAGTITSTVSVNTTSGFSIVTYTGTGANATVGHGLGVAPSMVIVKRRTGGIQNWIVWHTAIAANEYLYLNLTNAKATGAWNNTAPTSTVFSLDTATEYNATGSTYVAYCFAEVPGYSAFGSYTGNGSSDGPMIFTGFRPAYVLIKSSTDSNGRWEIKDTTRDPYNAATKRLWAERSDAEATGADVDFLSNGFKLRTTDGTINDNGGTFIYAAFSEVAFNYALGR
jgi:hypothetical protein